MSEALQAQFARAVVPPTVRLAGRVMGPLTIGHQILLQRVGSPFGRSKEPRDPSVGDVALAWFILSRSWHQAARSIGSRLARFQIAWFTIRRAGRHEADGAAIAEWISEANAFPPFTNRSDEGEDDEDQPSRGTPSELILAQAVSSDWNIGWPQVLDTPVAQANWLWLSKWEERGRITIGGEDAGGIEDALRRLADPLEAEKRQKLNAEFEARKNRNQ